MATKKERIIQEIAKAVGAGKPVSLGSVDFSDPNRPKTCLEVDFPILPINGIAKMEAHAGVTTKPVYQMSKWWARRPSSVFRSMLIAAATKAPDDPSYAAKLVWDNYYANHQKKGAFKHLKVADIFMGGGTTLVEGSRLGMQMSGNDLNPVAWFVVKQELSDVDLDEVTRLLADIEAEVKPQIMPYYYCDGPHGEKGTWTYKPTGEVMGLDFDPLALKSAERNDYDYQGPEIVYTFWAKHGPCQVTGCGYRTPIMTDPAMAIKSISVKSWEHTCPSCDTAFDIEATAARMAPDVPLYVAPKERPYVVLSENGNVCCPSCQSSFAAHIHPKTGLHIEGKRGQLRLGKGKNKAISLTLLVHPDWLEGSSKTDAHGMPYGGSPQDDADSTKTWNLERARHARLLEVRGKLPDTVTCPETNRTFATGKESGTVPKRSTFTCAACGTQQDVMKSTRESRKGGQVAGYAFQGILPVQKDSKVSHERFFSPFDGAAARQYNSALQEWENRKFKDLEPFWPKSEIPYGFMTVIANSDIRKNYGFTHWWTMFNPRQLLVHAQILKAIATCGEHSWKTREYVLGSFQNYLRNQSMFAFWHKKLGTLAPALSNSNFHPKTNVVETGVFSPVGYGPWSSATKPLFKSLEWKKSPWELARLESDLNLSEGQVGSTEKIPCTDAPTECKDISCQTSTDLLTYEDSSFDLVITDPPFGGLLHYSELSDFFYVWLRLVLKDKYPEIFQSELTPKAMEAVANRAREPEDPDGFYQRLLTGCWKEAHRILKPGGMLAFTFHHSEDAPWVSVLESLFDAGFYLEAT